jgi:glucan phosphoethanolaminetransferase (alkaline phosphatase superfamily)
LTAASIAIKLAITPLILTLSVLNFVLMANPITLIVMGVLAAVAAFTALVYWIDEATAWFNGLNPVIQALMIPLGLLINAIKWIKDNWSGIANSVGSVTSKISGAWSSLTTPSNATDQHATINKMQSPIKGLESKSTVNVNLRAQGAQVTSVDKKTTGRTKLNVGTNTLGK